MLFFSHPTPYYTVKAIQWNTEDLCIPKLVNSLFGVMYISVSVHSYWVNRVSVIIIAGPISYGDACQMGTALSLK